MADNFIDNVVDAGCQLAKHKQLDTITVSELAVAMGMDLYNYLLI